MLVFLRHAVSFELLLYFPTPDFLKLLSYRIPNGTCLSDHDGRGGMAYL